MGNSTSESKSAELKKSAYLTVEEQSSLRQMFATFSSDPMSLPAAVLAAFGAKDRQEFGSDLQIIFENDISTYDHFEDFVVNCTRSPSNKVIGTFWNLATKHKAIPTEERLTSFVLLVLELSLSVEDLYMYVHGDSVARMVDFMHTHFSIHGISASSSHDAVTLALITTLNNYLPCTSKALETYISRVCFQGMHSPSYKPFSAPALDTPSEILGGSDLLPLALHSEALQGAWKRLYSTSVDGLSFNRIVYHSVGYDGPTLVLIKCADAAGTVLGALSFDHWKESNRFYGTS